MKTTKKPIKVLICAFLIFLIGFFNFAVLIPPKVIANENNSQNYYSLYYISDTTPLATEEEIGLYLLNYDVYYHINYSMSSISFLNYINSLIPNINEGDIVLIELKLFRLPDATLDNAFDQLLDTGCEIVFISCYDDYEQYLMEDPINFICCQMDRYYTFINQSVRHMVENGFGYQPLLQPPQNRYILLLDNSILVPPEIDLSVVQDFDDHIVDYPYLKYVLDSFVQYLNPQPESTQYSGIVVSLATNCGIDIYVYDEDLDEYRSASFYNTSETFSLTDDIDDLQLWFTHTPGYTNLIKPIRAITFWEPPISVYGFYHSIQGQSTNNLKVYALEKDPIIFSWDGLLLTSDSDLLAYYNSLNGYYSDLENLLSCIFMVSWG